MSVLTAKVHHTNDRYLVLVGGGNCNHAFKEV